MKKLGISLVVVLVIFSSILLSQEIPINISRESQELEELDKMKENLADVEIKVIPTMRYDLIITSKEKKEGWFWKEDQANIKNIYLPKEPIELQYAVLKTVFLIIKLEGQEEEKVFEHLFKKLYYMLIATPPPTNVYIDFYNWDLLPKIVEKLRDYEITEEVEIDLTGGNWIFDGAYTDFEPWEHPILGMEQYIEGAVEGPSKPKMDFWYFLHENTEKVEIFLVERDIPTGTENDDIYKYVIIIKGPDTLNDNVGWQKDKTTGDQLYEFFYSIYHDKNGEDWEAVENVLPVYKALKEAKVTSGGFLDNIKYNLGTIGESKVDLTVYKLIFTGE